MASETGLDDSTAGEWLLGGMNPELQNAWGASSDKYTNITALANWAIEKETKLATLRHIQGHKTTTLSKNRTKSQETPMARISLGQPLKREKQWTWTHSDDDQD